MTRARLAARCIRGLEPVLAGEILRDELGVITRQGHREVRFDASRPGGWCEPRTADDVFLLAAEMPDPGPAKAGVAGLAELAAGMDAAALLRTRHAYSGDSARSPAASGRSRGPGTPGVEVSASFLGRRNFNRYDVEDAVGRALARVLGVGYHSRRSGTAPPPGCLGWRVVLDGEHAALMVRLGDRPAHRRAYKRATVPGTLHPPLAAAMALLADLRPEHRVVDPCCGAGTLLIEAARVQPHARYQGFDLAPAALRAARANADSHPAITIEAGDAGALPLPARSVDRVLANPPWGEQVRAYGRLAVRPARWWAELARVLADDGQAVVLIPDTADLAAAIGHGLRPAMVQQVSLFGAQPFIVRLVPARSLRRR